MSEQIEVYGAKAHNLRNLDVTIPRNALVVITGLAAIILTEPFVRSVLMLICAGYFLYLALRIAFAKSKIAFIHMSAPGFATGLTLNLVNPKAYAVHTILFGGFVLYPDNFLLEVVYKQVVLNFIWICDHFLWLYAGFKQPRFLYAKPRRLYARALQCARMRAMT